MKNIYELLSYKTYKQEIINIDDIKNIVDNYINKNGLSSFVREKFILEEQTNKKNIPAYYDSSNFRLIFFMKIISENILNNYAKLKVKYPDINLVNYYNYSLLECVLHELHHILQYKEIFLHEKNNDLVVDLYYLSHALQKKYADYEENITLFPVEREATIFSHDILFESFRRLDSEYVNNVEMKLFQKISLTDLLRDYKGRFNIKSPYEQLINIFQTDLYGDSLKKDYFQLYKRLVYGLPITKKEYKNVQGLYEEIDNGLINPRENIKTLILKRG